MVSNEVRKLERVAEFHRLLSINLARMGVHQASKQAVLVRYAATQAWFGKEVPKRQ